MSYARPKTVKEAVAALSGGSTPIAGGTVLAPLIAAGEASGKALVDLSRIDALRAIDLGSRSLRVGATTILARLAVAPEVTGAFAALSQAASVVGNPNVRRAGTVGGNVATRLPTINLAAALLALDAAVEWTAADGEHESPVLPILADGLPAGALLTAVRVPFTSGARSAFVKLAWRAASAWGVVNVAGFLLLRGGRVEVARLAAAGLRAHACRLPNAERVLTGERWSSELAEAAAQAAAEELPCEVEGPPSASYRRRLVAVGVEQVLAEAAGP
jgi:CO/xanthine dehydrogenase FAD-binding subunit